MKKYNVRDSKGRFVSKEDKMVLDSVESDGWFNGYSEGIKEGIDRGISEGKRIMGKGILDILMDDCCWDMVEIAGFIGKMKEKGLVG